MHQRQVLKRPLVTEKSTGLMGDRNAYTFEVDIHATKTDIRQAVESIFKVKVRDVNTMRLAGKTRRLGRFEGRKPDTKKAIVTLAPGERIEIFEGI